MTRLTPSAIGDLDMISELHSDGVHLVFHLRVGLKSGVNDQGL